MSGTTKQVRALGRPESALYVLATEFGKLVDDVEFVRSAVNTANGGAIDIAAASLTAGKIEFI